MKLGLVSDTHGAIENLRRAGRELAAHWQVDMIVHLGDEWEDFDVLRDLPVKKIIRVPGIYCQQYLDPDISNRVLENIEGCRVLFTHTDKINKNDLPGDPDPEELAAGQKVDVICYGHTHIPVIRRENHVAWLNPGHLKNQDKKGYPPSFAVLEIKGSHLKMWLIDFNSLKIVQKAEVD